MISVYLAARNRRRPELEEYRRQLERLGIGVTSRWLLAESPDDVTKLTDDDWRELASIDRDDIVRADALVLFTEEGAGGSGGRHVEFGIALGLDKIVIVVGPLEHLFHRLPEVRAVQSWDDALRLLVSLDS